MKTALPTASRSTLLRLRCEAQRQELGSQFEQIERKAHSVDSLLSSARRLVTRPAVLMGGLMLLLGMRKRRRRSDSAPEKGSRLWSLLSRGAVALATIRRLYGAFKA